MVGWGQGDTLDGSPLLLHTHTHTPGGDPVHPVCVFWNQDQSRVCPESRCDWWQESWRRSTRTPQNSTMQRERGGRQPRPVLLITLQCVCAAASRPGVIAHADVSFFKGIFNVINTENWWGWCLLEPSEAKSGFCCILGVRIWNNWASQKNKLGKCETILYIIRL